MQIKKKFVDLTTGTSGVNGQGIIANYPSPSNFTPAQVSSEGTDKVSAYFKGIDNALGATSQPSPVINFMTLDTSFVPAQSNNFNFEASVGDWAAFNNNSSTIAQSLTDNSAVSSTDTARWFGQSFVAGSSSSVASAAFKLSKSGTISGNAFCKIYDDSGGNPGSVIGTSDAFDASTLTGTATVSTFTFSTPPSLTNGNTYYAIMDITSVTVSIGNAFIVSVDSTQPYASGTEYFTLNSGSSWSTATNDLYFDVQSTATALTLTGGSPTIVMSRTTTSGEVLDGIASLKVVKSAANSENQGISCLTNIPLGYRGQVASFKFPFKVISGSLVSGDLQVVAYDVTNSQIITPTNNNASATGILQGTLQIPANTTQIRFGLYFANTSALAVTFSIDDVVFGPQEVVFGPSMTDWQHYTVEITATTTNPTKNGSAETDTAIWRQVGDTVEIIYNYFQSAAGSAGSGQYLFSLPPGMVIDTSKLSAPFADGNRTIIGSCELAQGGGNSYWGQVFVQDSTHFGMYGSAGGPTSNFVVDASDAGLGSDVAYNAFLKVPIVGLSTNVVQQNASTFQISNYLANGVRVVGTAPANLGEYRSYLKNAAAATYTETNGAPTATPNTTDGIKMYGGFSYAAGDSANSPTKYEIFIGKNKQYQMQWYQSTGKSGYFSPDVWLSGTNGVGSSNSYDPNTGIVEIIVPPLGASNNYAGMNDGTALNDGYFDIFVSEKVIPVQLNSNSEIWLQGNNNYGSTNTTIQRWSTISKNIGSAMTLTQSSTDGDSILINSPGVYSVAFAKDNNAGQVYFGISKNSNQLTTAIQSITSTDIITITMSTGVNYMGHCSDSLNLNAGDVIRAHGDGNNAGTSAAFSYFRITKVS